LVFSAYEDRSPELDADDDRLTEIHLYFGPFCNRSCDFCVVFGSPEGWMAEVDAHLLDHLLELIHPEAQLKIYGGEPTLLRDNLLWAFRYLREAGFAGRLVIFSNGVQAGRLIQLLEEDEHSCCVLNYSILTGTDAEPLPPAALRSLSAYECDHPGRIFAGHAALVEVGRAIDWERQQSSGRDDFAGACPRCHPVVTTRGQHHACPFAVENPAAHYQLGDLETPPEEVLRNFRAFLEWIDTVLEPAAEHQRRHPCAVCVAPENLPMPAYAVPATAQP
jgi:hypothetical protein